MDAELETTFTISLPPSIKEIHMMGIDYSNEH